MLLNQTNYSCNKLIKNNRNKTHLYLDVAQVIWKSQCLSFFKTHESMNIKQYIGASIKLVPGPLRQNKKQEEDRKITLLNVRIRHPSKKSLFCTNNVHI